MRLYLLNQTLILIKYIVQISDKDEPVLTSHKTNARHIMLISFD